MQNLVGKYHVKHTQYVSSTNNTFGYVFPWQIISWVQCLGKACKGFHNKLPNTLKSVRIVSTDCANGIHTVATLQAAAAATTFTAFPEGRH